MVDEASYELKFLHIDMDAFFASIEQRDNINLIGLPVIISGNKDKRSVVSTCSYEAREYGIKSSMPTKTAYKLCPNGIFIYPRIDYYLKISKQIRNILTQFTDKVEMFSLDEAYLDISENKIKNNISPVELALKIQKEIFNKLKLTCSIGISFTKFLAKIASDYKKPNGLTVFDKYNFISNIDSLDISKIYGIGKATSIKLRSIGVNFCRDLRLLSKEFLINKFGKSGDMLYNNIHGIGTNTITIDRIQKTFSNEITLEADVNKNESFSFIRKCILNIYNSIITKNVFCRTICLKLKFSDFSSITRQLTTRNVIDNCDNMISLFKFIIDNKVKINKKMRLVGVKVSNFAICEGYNRQLSLF